MPSYEVVTQLLPVIDSKNPDFKNDAPNEPIPTPSPANVSAPIPVATPSPGLAYYDPAVINDLLNTVKILKKKQKIDTEIMADKDKIISRQAAKIEQLTQENHTQGYKLRQARFELNSIRSRPMTFKQKKAVVESVMGKFGYSQTQLNCFLRGNWQRVKGWTEEDVKFALSLRTISRKAYTWIRRRKLIPLPGESTLRRYMRNIQVPPGMSHCILHYIHILYFKSRKVLL